MAPINKSVTLQYNMNSSDVKSAQTMLDGLGYKPGRKDGYFDAATKEAVKKFQSTSKLQATGAIDAKTAEALELALIKVIQDPANDNQRNRGIEEVRKEIQKAASNK